MDTNWLQVDVRYQARDQVLPQVWEPTWAQVRDALIPPLCWVIQEVRDGI